MDAVKGNGVALGHFNSIKVRLELLRKVLMVQLIHFNSIKVRLERLRPCMSRAEISVFQFHKGAIRTSKGR